MNTPTLGHHLRLFCIETLWTREHTKNLSIFGSEKKCIGAVCILSGVGGWGRVDQENNMIFYKYSQYIFKGVLIQNWSFYIIC